MRGEGVKKCLFLSTELLNDPLDAKMVMIRPSDGTMFEFKVKENYLFLLFGHYFLHSDFEANEKNIRLCI